MVKTDIGEYMTQRKLNRHSSLPLKRLDRSALQNFPLFEVLSELF